MDSAARKWSITEQLALISDDSVLEQIQQFIAKKLRGVAEAEEISDEEVAELDKRRARRLSGEGKGYTAEESIRMLRAAQAKDEAV